MLVSDPIPNRSTEIRGERSSTFWLERVEPRESSNECVLYEIGRIRRGTEPSWKAPARPSAQVGQVTIDEQGQRAGIAVTCA